MTNAQNPALILLDCQRDRVEGPDGRIDADNHAAMTRIEALLRRARADGWSICHCQHAITDGARADRTPVPALRPLTREPVFVRRGLSAFSDSYFHQFMARNTGRDCLLVGFSAPFSILATLFDAQTRDIPLTLVPEAVGALAVAPRDVAETRALAFDLAGRLAPSLSLEAIDRQWPRLAETAG